MGNKRRKTISNLRRRRRRAVDREQRFNGGRWHQPSASILKSLKELDVYTTVAVDRGGESYSAKVEYTLDELRASMRIPADVKAQIEKGSKELSRLTGTPPNRIFLAMNETTAKALGLIGDEPRDGWKEGGDQIAEVMRAIDAKLVLNSVLPDCSIVTIEPPPSMIDLLSENAFDV
jgi:hypothetical protein